MTIPQNMKFDSQGLITAIAQDAHNGEILMVAFMNEEALNLSITTGVAHYYSRSRQKLWKKGESSGHLQHIMEMRLDCDQDAVLMKIEQVGGACHVGFRSCFYRKIEQDGSLTEDGEKVFDPKDAYNK